MFTADGPVFSGCLCSDQSGSIRQLLNQQSSITTTRWLKLNATSDDSVCHPVYSPPPGFCEGTRWRSFRRCGSSKVVWTCEINPPSTENWLAKLTTSFRKWIRSSNVGKKTHELRGSSEYDRQLLPRRPSARVLSNSTSNHFCVFYSPVAVAAILWVHSKSYSALDVHPTTLFRKFN